MRLKAATQREHERIERRMPFDTPQFDVGGYRELLAALYGFYRPLEDDLAATVREIAALQWAQRVKLPLLALDLHALGLRSADLHGLPACTDLPGVATRARALGCLYVLEGSTLGGQVLQRMVAARFGAPVADALRFLRSYGQEVGARWRSFLCCLEGLPHGPPAAQAEAAARETFIALESWLERQKVLR